MRSTPPINNHVSIVVPLYYASPILYKPIAECFCSIAELKGRKQVLVIDDASPIEVPFRYTHTNSSNLGFTKTVNRGLKVADGAILIVMNDDVLITQECFDRFSRLDPNKLIIASPADTASSPDDRFGSCWAITRAAYNLLGPLDERYKNFYSDREYYDRAKAQGVQIIKWHDIVLEHPESSTYKLLDKASLLHEDQLQYDSVR